MIDHSPLASGAIIRGVTTLRCLAPAGARSRLVTQGEITPSLSEKVKLSF